MGALLGALLALTAWLLVGPLPPLLVAALLVALLAALSGGLHLDGLADWFAALGGGRGDRTRMLAIMREPHVGAHGASALVLCLALKLAALVPLVTARDMIAIACLPVVGRAAVVPLVALFAPARDDGLAHAFATKRGLVPLAITLLLVAVPLAMLARIVLVAGFVAALLLAFVVGAWARARIGGVTGDVHSAAIELGETLFAIAVVASL
jgi:adenosylcobinamide-GDP ribazoletransferase